MDANVMMRNNMFHTPFEVETASIKNPENRSRPGQPTWLRLELTRLYPTLDQIILKLLSHWSVKVQSKHLQEILFLKKFLVAGFLE